MRNIKIFTIALLFISAFSCRKTSTVNPGGGGTTNPVATISSMSPSSTNAGSPAFTLTVNGSNFINGSVINWNGTALVTTFVSATQLNATISAGLVATAGTANITVFNTTPGGGTSNVGVFTINAVTGNAVPAISALSPASVFAGNAAFTLTVTGTDFISSSTIYWNGTAITTTFVGPLQLTASVSAALVATAGTSNVSVVTGPPGGGISNSLPFTITAAGSNPVPTATALLPNTTTAGNPAFTLTVNGSNFINGSVVKWNGTALTTTYVSATQLTAAVLANLVTTAGTANVTVVNGTPGGGISNALSFTINPIPNNPVPTATSLSPASATAGSAQFTLTVNGTNFISSSAVKWNGNPLTTIYVSNLQVTATVSAALVSAAGTASVTVVNPAPGGGTSNALTFTINSAGNNPVPTLTTIAPTSVTAGAAGFTLTANGTNFIAGSSIKWNGTALATSYVTGSQLTAPITSAMVATAGTASVTVFNPTPGGGTSGSMNFTINPAGSSPKKFLFDATKAETAGNADWVIDEDPVGSTYVPQRIPTPLQSTVTSTTPENYWTGAISSFGIALVKLGHTVETLPSGTAITYGNAGNPQDLSNYNVFVVDEPNIVFTTAEKQALLNFVNNGGGLFMVSDHTGSDRNGDGWDSPAIWNDFMTNNGVISNPFGFSVDLTNFSQVSTNVLTGNPTNPILHGSQGNVTQLSFNNGASLTLTSSNTNVQGLVWQNTYAQGTTHVMSASSSYGTGRVFCVTDSSPLDDGTGAPGNSLYVSWSLYSHTQLFMNAALWLAKLQ